MTGFIGVLMLDTAFERVPGDAGHPASFHRPARARVVAGAGSPEVVRDGRPDADLARAFVAAARALEAEGAAAITSTCGFLAPLQDEVAEAVRVPVMLSALALFGLLRQSHGGRPIGILTASARSLGPATLSAAGIEPGAARVAGLEDSAVFAATFLAAKGHQPGRIDRAALEAAVVARAVALCDRCPETPALLLECGNLPPYAGAIARATGRPVHSILDGLRLIAP